MNEPQPLRFAWEQAIRGSDLPLPAKGTLFLMATYGDLDGANIWPSISRLVRDTGKDERTIRRHIDAAERKGWIVKVHPHRKGLGRTQAQSYVLTVPDQWTPMSTGDGDIAEVSGSQGDQRTQAPGSCGEMAAGSTGPGDQRTQAPGSEGEDVEDVDQSPSATVPGTFPEPGRADQRTLVTRPADIGDPTSGQQCPDTSARPTQRPDANATPPGWGVRGEGAAADAASAVAPAGDGLRPRGFAAPVEPEGSPWWSPEDIEARRVEWKDIEAALEHAEQDVLDALIGELISVDAVAAEWASRQLARRAPQLGAGLAGTRRLAKYTLAYRPLACWPLEVLPTALHAYATAEEPSATVPDHSRNVPGTFQERSESAPAELDPESQRERDMVVAEIAAMQWPELSDLMFALRHSDWGTVHAATQQANAEQPTATPEALVRATVQRALTSRPLAAWPQHVLPAVLRMIVDPQEAGAA